MAACTFFGHKECHGVNLQILRNTIEDLIGRGVDTFYVGNHGDFDRLVYGCLKQLRKLYSNVRVFVVLAYLPTKKRDGEDHSDTMYPEIEGHPKYSILRRNRWMIERSEYCICYINHAWGGAHKHARLAKRKGLAVVNLGDPTVEL